MRDAATLILAVCGGVVTVSAALGIAWWLIKPRLQGWVEDQLVTPVRETHHQVTVNHHSSEEPTVLDKLSDLDRAVAGVAEENRSQNHKIDSVQRDVTALTVVLDAHLHGGDVGDEPDLS